MSDRRKVGPVRQLSLQSDVRRPLMKKQLSVEHLEDISEQKLPGRKIESAKSNRLSDRPRPIKVAWAENRQHSRDEPGTPKPRFGDPVEVKKCKEFKRPVTAKEPRFRTQVSLDSKSIEKDSILYTRQELAERLRKAWKDRVENKQNLDIFLGNNIQDKYEENGICYDKVVESVSSPKSDLPEETIPIKKSQKLQKQKTVASEFCYVPSTTSNKPQDVRTNISVTIPTVTNQKILESQPNSLEVKPPESETKIEIEHKPKLVKQTSLINKENESIARNLPQRPSTAASKRESFQKRTNTAFTTTISPPSNFRPPLNRALSVPVKSDGQKLKFIASKRRLKSARRKGRDEESLPEAEGDEEKTSKKSSRCKSAAGAELVTMVSLVSPAGSDNEEQEVKKEAKKEDEVKNGDVKSQVKKFTKSVSFQQSSIHSVRSFSASFPSRRQVMSISSGTLAAEREKRAPVESPPGHDDSRRHKRRLVRAVSVGGDVERSDLEDRSCSSFDEDQSSADVPENPKQNISGVTKAEILPATRKQDSVEKKSDVKDGEQKEENSEENSDPSIPKFESNRERECWIMFKKMSEKGLPVSYETILRGMLTPTQYRSARKEINPLLN